MKHSALRKEVIETARAINTLGINQGTLGNISARIETGLLVTPSGVPYEDCAPEDVVEMDAEGCYSSIRRPSSEWRFHRDILLSHPEVNAVIHTHSTFATTLACLGLTIPAFHYRIAVAGGIDIRCADYATPGSPAHSDYILKALEDRCACLVANHGMVCIGDTLKATLALAVEVETLAEQYWRALQIAEPTLLSETEIDAIRQSFKTYGQSKSGIGDAD